MISHPDSEPEKHLASPPDEKSGGQGDAILEALEDPHHRRRDIGMVQQAVQKGWVKPWNVSSGIREKLPGIVEGIIDDKWAEDKTKLRAADIIRGFNSDNLQLAEALDKEARLDEGRPTENIAHLTPEQERRADEIAERFDAC